MLEESASKVNFHPTPSISLQAVELEEAVLGAILLDPGALAQVEGLPVQAFSIFAHQEIFKMMLELRRSGLQPDLLTVAFQMSQRGTLKPIGGQIKLASLLDRTVHSGNIKQYAQLLQQKYQRRFLSDSISSIARLAETELDFDSAIEQAQQQLEIIRTVTSDTTKSVDISKLDSARLSTSVTSVTKILEKGLPDWQEQAHLDALQLQSGISKAAFAQLVASLRCQSEEVIPHDEQHLGQLIEWRNVKIDFKTVLPHLAEDLLHDGGVLNIDPIMLWQYLLPATLSLAGKRVDLDVSSHTVPAIAWTCIVGESGTGKSRAEGLILSWLKTWQQEEYKRFKTEWQEYKQSQNKKDGDSQLVAAPLSERKFLFEVATIQAVMRRLSEQNDNGSLWARDEIAGLFKSLGQFSAKGEGEGLECLLPMWDGASAPVDRVLHEDSYYLDSSRLSIAGGLQPGVFRQIFQDPDDAQGLQARFLFALPKVQPAKRVKGYCRLSDKLPSFYRWVDTAFPTGTVKFSRAADSRYDAVYEQIGRQAELAQTPAIRAWMRKLPSQLLRIALALHIIECYHEPTRPRHYIQVDTLNRAVEFCRYYRSTFEVVQQSASDSDALSSILLKVWDMAATSPTGLAVRDAYRSIKALSRRAKELGRSVSAYTIDLYYQLEKMGKGTVHKEGRTVRFVVGTPNPPSSPPRGNGPINSSSSLPTRDDIDGVTVVTVDETTVAQELDVSSLLVVSPVPKLDERQINLSTGEINRVQPSLISYTGSTEGANESVEPLSHQVGDSCSQIAQINPLGLRSQEPGVRNENVSVLPIQTDSVAGAENRPTGCELESVADSGVDSESKARKVDECVSGSMFTPSSPTKASKFSDGSAGISSTQLQQWLDRIASCRHAQDCMSCLEALNSLPQPIEEYIWQSAVPLLPRFWEVAEIEAPLELPENSFTGFDESADSPIKAHPFDALDGNAPTSHPSDSETATSPVLHRLVTGLWVRCRDGFYGYLGAMLNDGRWWVMSPKTRTHDASSRLVAESDIIPMPTA